MKEIIKNALILCIITLVAAFLLSFVNGITSDVIIKNEIEKQEQFFLEIMPNAEDFKAIEIEKDNNFNVNSAYMGTKGTDEIGYLFNVTTTGYSGEMKLIVGINTDGTVVGVSILAQSETKELDSNFILQFKDKLAKIFTVVTKGTSDSNEVQATSGVTVSSKAVTTAVNNAIGIYHELVGGLD